MFHSWIEVFSSFNRTRIFGKIWLAVTGLAIYTTLVALLLHGIGWIDKLVNIHANFHAYLGVALGLLLVFRTNTAYDRWWEGRKLWGQLVNDSRNLAIKVQTSVRADVEEKQLLGRRLIAFALALKDSLRGEIRLSQIEGFGDTRDSPSHVPLYLAQLISEQIADWRRTERIDGYELLYIDRHAAALMDVCGACERIRKTPISPSYTWFVRQSIAIFLVTLPWGLVDDLGYWSIPSAALISYFLIGIELLGEGIEDPFGTEDDDLKLDDICRTIQQSVTQVLFFRKS